MTTRTQQRAKEAAQRNQARAAMLKLTHRIADLHTAYVRYQNDIDGLFTADHLATAVGEFLNGE